MNQVVQNLIIKYSTVLNQKDGLNNE